jgi:hypothetical protein
MAGRYEFYLCNTEGYQETPLNFTEWTASKVQRGIGKFYGTLSSSFDVRRLQRDKLIQMWRAPSGGVPGLWQVFFLRWFEYGISDGTRYIHLRGKDPKDHLRRRIVAYREGSGQSDKTGYADDLMKDVVSEAFYDGSNPAPSYGTRVIDDLTIAPDASLGPSVTVRLAWEQLVSESGTGALITIADEAKRKGTEVFFDLKPFLKSSGGVGWRFETMVGVMGQDLTTKPQVVFVQGSNLKNPKIEVDYRTEGNYIYVGGREVSGIQTVAQVYDASAIRASKWNRCERYIGASSSDVTAVLEAVGARELREYRAVMRFQGWAQDSDIATYGRHWDFGDKVVAQWPPFKFYPTVSSLVLSFENGKESIIAHLTEEEEVLW